MLPRNSSRTRVITGTVRCHRDVLNGVCIRNDVGGTGELPVGTYRVRIVRSWHDEEIGWRCVGELLDAADVEASRRAGMTGYSPEHYKRYGVEHYVDVLRASREFDPGRVYFPLHDFRRDTGAGDAYPAPQ